MSLDLMKAYGAASSSCALSDVSCEIVKMFEKEKNKDKRQALNEVLTLLETKEKYYDKVRDDYMKEKKL